MSWVCHFGTPFVIFVIRYDMLAKSQSSMFGTIFANGVITIQVSIIKIRIIMENEILNVVKRMSKIADGNPFVFDCAIIENGSDEGETMTFCLCDEGQYDKIAQTYFDNMIFFYINKPEDIIGFLNGSEDFNVVDVYETSMEIIYKEDLGLA